MSILSFIYKKNWILFYFILFIYDILLLFFHFSISLYVFCIIFYNIFHSQFLLSLHLTKNDDLKKTKTIVDRIKVLPIVKLLEKKTNYSFKSQCKFFLCKWLLSLHFHVFIRQVNYMSTFQHMRFVQKVHSFYWKLKQLKYQLHV